MGIRKGRVLAPGVPPLSYYLKEDGVKEFTLVAQPIEQKIMDVNDYKYYQEVILPFLEPPPCLFPTCPSFLAVLNQLILSLLMS